MSHPHHSAHTPPDVEAPDAWHSHSGDERPQKAHGELTNAHLIVLFGIGSFVIVLVCAIAVYAYYIHYSTEQLNRQELTKQAGIEGEALAYKRGKQAALAEGYEWADHAHVQLPIADAMAKVARQYAERPAPAPGR